MSDGLIGAIKRSSAGIAGSIKNHDAWAIRLVFFAGIITILHKAGVPVSHYGVLFAVALGVAALLYEMNATTYALRAFWGGRFIGTIGWSFVWAVAFAYSMNQWVGAASENEAGKSNIHKAAFTQQVDTRAAVKRAEAEVNRLEKRLASQPVRTADAAQAAIDNAMAHKWWKLTDGCKATKGPQTRSFCSDYASAVADKAGATDAIQVKEELSSAKADLVKAREQAGAAPAEFTEARNDLVILTKFAGLNEDDARVLNALGSIIAISIFLSIATALRELEHLRATKNRVPMFPLRALWAKLYKAVTGKDISPAHIAVSKTPLSDLVSMPS